MSNTTTTTTTTYYGIFYTHPMTDKRCALGRQFTSREAAQYACDQRNAGWHGMHYFVREVQ